MYFHGCRANLNSSRVSLYCFMVTVSASFEPSDSKTSQKDSRISFYSLRMSLYGSRESRHGSRMSFHGSGVNIYDIRVRFHATELASKFQSRYTWRGSTAQG
jgi:hypothetical protein